MLLQSLPSQRIMHWVLTMAMEPSRASEVLRTVLVATIALYLPPTSPNNTPDPRSTPRETFRAIFSFFLTTQGSRWDSNTVPR